MSKYRNIDVFNTASDGVSAEQAPTLAEMFKALANPHRLSMFQQLLGCCAPGTVCAMSPGAAPCCVGDLGHDLDIAPSTLSHHLRELSRAGLVRTRRRGQHVDCWVDPAGVAALQQFFDILPKTGTTESR